MIRPVGSDSTLMLVGKFRTILEIHSHDCLGIERSKLYSAMREKMDESIFWYDLPLFLHLHKGIVYISRFSVTVDQVSSLRIKLEFILFILKTTLL